MSPDLKTQPQILALRSVADLSHVMYHAPNLGPVFFSAGAPLKVHRSVSEVPNVQQFGAREAKSAVGKAFERQRFQSETSCTHSFPLACRKAVAEFGSDSVSDIYISRFGKEGQDAFHRKSNENAAD